MNRCRRCGEVFQPEDRFCSFCGFNFAAQETSELATRIAIKSEDIQLDLALIYHKEGKHEQALDILERLLEDNPDNEQAQTMQKEILAALDE
jgi:tetratricopeptide (TPR) repeat protein